LAGIERDWEEILPFLVEKDHFRLVIRGQVLVEDILNKGIDAALPAGTPGELKHLNLPARLALAQALDLITPELAQAVRALSKIRNEFAHGFGEEVTPDHAKVITEAIKPFVDENFDPDDYSEGDLVRVAVGVIWETIEDTVLYALEQRKRAEAVLAEYGRSRTLTAADISALLEADAKADQ
jgi:hypothetical protein